MNNAKRKCLGGTKPIRNNSRHIGQMKAGKIKAQYTVQMQIQQILNYVLMLKLYSYTAP